MPINLKPAWVDEWRGSSLNLSMKLFSTLGQGSPSLAVDCTSLLRNTKNRVKCKCRKGCFLAVQQLTIHWHDNSLDRCPLGVPKLVHRSIELEGFGTWTPSLVAKNLQVEDQLLTRVHTPLGQFVLLQFLINCKKNYCEQFFLFSFFLFKQTAKILFFIKKKKKIFLQQSDFFLWHDSVWPLTRWTGLPAQVWIP